MTSEKVKTPRIKKKRAWELDFFRGIAILLVAWDHTMYDMAYFFGYTWRQSGIEGLEKAGYFALDYIQGGLRAFWQPVFVFIFFFVSGICTAFSKNNFLRGIKLAAVALLVTLATYILEYQIGMDGTLIIFGVLHCLASCILLFALIEFLVKLLNRKNNRFLRALVYAAFAIALFILDRKFNVRFTEANTYENVVQANWFGAGFFVYTQEVWLMTADYFPILPFFSFFMMGAAISPIVYPNKKSLLPFLDGKWHLPFTVPGRLSLIIYLAIQVVAVGALAAITYFTTGSLGI